MQLQQSVLSTVKAARAGSIQVVFVDGEAAVVRVLHVDPTHEDFVYDLVSSNFDRDHYRERTDKSYVARFDDLVSAELQK